MTLAMASHSQLMWKNFTVSRSYFSDQPARLPAILIRRDGGLEKSTSEIKNDFPSAALLEKQPQPSHDGLVLFARKNLGLNRSMSVQAGYEQVCGNDSVLRKISPDGQEPGFACVKASFNF